MSDSLQNLKRILDTLKDSVLVVNSQNQVLFANTEAHSLLDGVSLIGDILPFKIDNSHIDRQEFAKATTTGVVWTEISSSPIVWEDSNAYLLEIRDINRRKQTELDLGESEAMFRTLAKIAPVGIYKTDCEGYYQYVNQRWCEISGLKTLDAHEMGWTQAILDEDKPNVLNNWQQCLREHSSFNSQHRLLHSDGSVHWVISQAAAELDSNGQFLGYVGTITEITAIKNHEQRLSQAAAVFETTREGVMITDAHLKIQMVNRAFTEITGYSAEEALGNTPKMLQSGKHSPYFYAELWSDIKQSEYWQGEIWNRRKNGQIYPELLSISTIKDQYGNISNYVGVFADISKLKASERELEFLAHHDPLTKLPNRILFLSRLEHCLDRAKRNGSFTAVLMLDLDRFKDVNDSFGHLAGDELLQLVAKCLSSRLRATDSICRLGGDEFTVLLEDIPSSNAAARVASQIINALNQVWLLPNGNEARIGVSIGIALFPDHGSTAEELIQQADTALYKAKNEGRNRYKYFSEDLTQAARERVETEILLRQGIDHGDLRVFYQPQIDVNTGQIIGAEALVRWLSASGELIQPVRFITIAGETGLITTIGNWVLQEACRQGKQWLDAGLAPLNIAVNLSSHQFLHSDISEIVAKTLQDTGFPAQHLELELTESALMKRELEGIEILQNLHDQGIKLAIDDFGTGYSSLAYLKLFPLDVLKIDKSFIDDIPQKTDDMEITATIIAMAKTLRMQVIAEGVETPAQLDFLKSRHCDFYQGYLASKPLPANEFEAFLRHHSKGLNL